ncbi:MAG: MarR family transcriptional regulator [Hyphomicrobium sp.]|nr:MarR family transcriptional regulator [Hyphomicrobium sp.]PPC80507.1 MAG: MarR family transcriptional regulator [Hyphomicrobium sp.]
MLMKEVLPPAQGGRQSSALHLLHRAGQCADELFAIQIGKSDLTPRQYVVMKAVAATDEPSQTQIVEKTGIDRSTLADIVRRLVAKGLLQRKRTRRDARMYAVRLTDKGNAILKSAEPAAKSTDERVLSALSQSQRDGFLEALKRIIDVLDVSNADRIGR